MFDRYNRADLVCFSYADQIGRCQFVVLPKSNLEKYVPFLAARLSWPYKTLDIVDGLKTIHLTPHAYLGTENVTAFGWLMKYVSLHCEFGKYYLHMLKDDRLGQHVPTLHPSKYTVCNQGFRWATNHL